MTSTMTTRSPRAAQRIRRWRTVDIVIGSVLAVAFGVVFWGWGEFYAAVSAGSWAFGPASGLLNGVWLMAGVTGALVIRRPGAAIYTELVGGVVESALGSQWGLSNVVYGLVQGAAVEFVFALLLYRVWRAPVAVLAGALSGAAAAVLDLWVYHYYDGWSGSWMASYFTLVATSGAVFAGLGSWALVRALARTGVLAPFAAGRTATEV